MLPSGKPAGLRLLSTRAYCDSTSAPALVTHIVLLGFICRGLQTRADRSLNGAGVVLTMLRFFGPSLAKAGLVAPKLTAPFAKIVDRVVTNTWLRRFLDLECFVLSGMLAKDTICAEVSPALPCLCCLGRSVERTRRGESGVRLLGATLYVCHLSRDECGQDLALLVVSGKPARGIVYIQTRLGLGIARPWGRHFCFSRLDVAQCPMLQSAIRCLVSHMTMPLQTTLRLGHASRQKNEHAIVWVQMAFMLMERNSGNSTIDYPIDGSKGIVDALVRGIEKNGGNVMLRARVEDVLIEGETLFCSQFSQQPDYD